MDWGSFAAGVSVGGWLMLVGIVLLVVARQDRGGVRGKVPDGATGKPLPPRGGSGTGTPPKVVNVPTVWPDVPILPPHGGTFIIRDGEFRELGEDKPPAKR